MGYDEVLLEARSILATGAYDAAQRADLVLMDFVRSCQNDRDRGMVLQASAQVLAMQGLVSAAIERFTDAESLLQCPCDRVTLYEGYANVIVKAGRIGLGQHVLNGLESVILACSVDEKPALAFAFVALARLHLLLSNNYEGTVAANTAVSLSLETGQGMAEAYSVLAATCEASGDIVGAIDALEIAMSHMQSAHCIMEAEGEYSRLAIVLGDVKTAAFHLCKAVELPDLRDRRVIASVIKVFGAMVRFDPESAIALSERLSAFLINSAELGEVKI